MFTDDLILWSSIRHKGNLSEIISGVDTIKICTESNRVRAAIILEDLDVQHFGTSQGKNGQNLCTM